MSGTNLFEHTLCDLNAGRRHTEFLRQRDGALSVINGSLVLPRSTQYEREGGFSAGLPRRLLKLLSHPLRRLQQRECCYSVVETQVSIKPDMAHDFGVEQRGCITGLLKQRLRFEEVGSGTIKVIPQDLPNETETE